MRFAILAAFAVTLIAGGWLLTTPAALADNPQEERDRIESLQEESTPPDAEEAIEEEVMEEEATGTDEVTEEETTEGDTTEAAVIEEEAPADSSGEGAASVEGEDEGAAEDEAGGEAGGAAAGFEGTPEEKGRAIAEAKDEAGSGFKWSTAQGRMILHDAHGNSNERTFDSRILEDSDDSDDEGGRGIIVFLHPPDIKNTALLTIAQHDDDDYQWLYLPALKRVKRISGSGKTGSFVGSEFTFEDLGSQDLEDYTYVWLRDEPCPGAEDLTCYVIERTPKDDDSGYSRVVNWSDVEHYRTYQNDFYDRKGTLLKTLTVKRHGEFKDKFWRPLSMEMVNHVNGKSTEMLWSSYDFDTPLNESDFTVRALERLQ